MDAQLFVPIKRTATINLEVVDFGVVVQPANMVLLTGCEAQFQISFAPVGNFNAPLYLSVANLPPDATMRFSAPNPVAVTDTVTLVVDCSNVAPGQYTMQLEAVPGT
jgi:hypothetical protein